jgi:hypothetical protein
VKKNYCFFQNRGKPEGGIEDFVLDIHIIGELGLRSPTPAHTSEMCKGNKTLARQDGLPPLHCTDVSPGLHIKDVLGDRWLPPGCTSVRQQSRNLHKFCCKHRFSLRQLLKHVDFSTWARVLELVCTGTTALPPASARGQGGGVWGRGSFAHL